MLDPQPIETAPRTGDALLLIWAGIGAEVGFWDERASAWGSPWRWFDVQPTHWAPLPDLREKDAP